MSLRTVQPQKKYGLINKMIPIPKRTILKSSLFFSDELNENENNDNENEDNKKEIISDIQRVNKSLIERNTIDNIDIYDYDGYLDTKEQNNKTDSSSSSSLLLSTGNSDLLTGNQKLKSKTNAPAATYVHNLKSAAVTREKEKDRIFERKLLKERQTEESKEGGDSSSGNNEVKFVTSAYKKKLMEQKKWENEDRIMDEVEKRTDCRSTLGKDGEGMMGFYSNLLTKNIAMGTDVEDAALSAYTSGSKRQLSLLSSSSSSNEDPKALNTSNTHQEENNDNKRHCITSNSNSNNNYGNGSEMDKIVKNVPAEVKIEVEVEVETVRQVDPKQNVQSARDRYLARMNKVA